MELRSSSEGTPSGARSSLKSIQPARDAWIGALTVLVAFSIAVLFAWRTSLREQSDRVLDEVVLSAESAARMLRRDLYESQVVACDGEREMLAAETRRLQLLKSTQSRLVGLYLLVEEGDRLVVGLDADDRSDLGPRSTRKAARDALETRATRTSEEYAAEVGDIVSVYTPLYVRDGEVAGIVGADVLASTLREGDGASGEILLYGSLFTLVCMVAMAGLLYRLRSNMRDVMVAQEARMSAVERNAAELSRAQEHAGSVLASMSHEVRTPLTAILGFTELLLEPNEDVSVLRRHAQTIRRNSKHLLDVLNDALDMSKIDAGMMRIHAHPFDPRRMIHEVVDLFHPRAREKQISLRVVEEGPLPASVECDEFRLRQILINLLSNGLKFTEHGGVTVVVRYDGEAQALECRVSDTGIGIAPAHIDSIFKPYQQILDDDVRRFGGTGLGLAIGKRLAELLEGSLSVESVPGHGATFTLRVAAPSATADAVAGRGSEDPVDTWKPHPSWRVLLAEDRLEHQKIIYAMLRRAGHAVDVCDSGERALKLVREAEYLREPYTILILDAHLPGMSGSATARSAREHGFRGVIVALTADETEATREECRSSGCDEVLTKPIERERLFSVLSRLVRGAPSAGAA